MQEFIGTLGKKNSTESSGKVSAGMFREPVFSQSGRFHEKRDSGDKPKSLYLFKWRRRGDSALHGGHSLANRLARDSRLVSSPTLTSCQSGYPKTRRPRQADAPVEADITERTGEIFQVHDEVCVPQASELPRRDLPFVHAQFSKDLPRDRGAELFLVMPRAASVPFFCRPDPDVIKE